MWVSTRQQKIILLLFVFVGWSGGCLWELSLLPLGCEHLLARRSPAKSSAVWIFCPSLPKICPHVIVPCARSLTIPGSCFLRRNKTFCVSSACSKADSHARRRSRLQKQRSLCFQR